jgi:hypothetical protein
LGIVVGWVREQAVVVGSQWLCWSLEVVGGEGACMGVVMSVGEREQAVVRGGDGVVEW